MDLGASLFPDQLGYLRIPLARPSSAEERFAPEGFHSRQLDRIDVFRHDDHRVNSEPLCRAGNSLRVVAARSADHSAALLLITQRKQAVGCPAQLKGAGIL